MPDYSACGNKECPKKTECCRWLMVTDKYQTYSTFAWHKDTGCDSFWDVKEGAPFELKKQCWQCKDWRESQFMNPEGGRCICCS